MRIALLYTVAICDLAICLSYHPTISKSPLVAVQRHSRLTQNNCYDFTSYLDSSERETNRVYVLEAWTVSGEARLALFTTVSMTLFRRVTFRLQRRQLRVTRLHK
jgi:hypothetical protein